MKILVAEDDLTLQGLLATYFAERGYDVVAAANGSQALTLARNEHPQLIILDVMMPGMDGWQVLGELRKASNVPVIFLTAKSSEADVVHGLELGADDYLKKPVSLIELGLRVQALLRRSAEGRSAPTAFTDERLRVDPGRRLVIVDGQVVHLTPTEYRLLIFLVQRRGGPVTHRELLTEVWGPEYAEDVATLQVYIRYLREKVERDPKRPSYIMTERGIGYRFQTQQAAASGNAGASLAAS